MCPICCCYWVSGLPLSLPLPSLALFLLRAQPDSSFLSILISHPPPSPFFSVYQTTSRWDHFQCGLIQISEKQCVNSLVSHRARWTTATSALRPLGLKSVTSDPWETLMHNDTGEQCGPSSVCPKRATVDCRSYNLSWIHHSPESGPLPSETTGLVELELELHPVSGAETGGMAGVYLCVKCPCVCIREGKYVRLYSYRLLMTSLTVHEQKHLMRWWNWLIFFPFRLNASLQMFKEFE